MSILMFIFLISEYFILSSKNLAFKNALIIIDDVLIFISAIIFLVSFIFIKDLKLIHLVFVLISTIFVWFFGRGLRLIGINKIKNHNTKPLKSFLIIRYLLMFFDLPVIALNFANIKQNENKL